ncbi:hypothetical protein IEQ34_003392 [Dendrobium chrysotoxum]|uniref:Uncharacterized protein n=1 Tax=Dendrobium chrysotoxum TaxID=161865 RepID=A0AAV7H3L9_DENCH|nr:hypothetical protein IEQ34_003392 [Dendrobium chrysotoxum]
MLDHLHCMPVEDDKLSLAIAIMEANKRFGYDSASNGVVSRFQYFRGSYFVEVIFHGAKVEVRTLNCHGLLSNMSKISREKSLLLDKVLLSKEKGIVVDTFYITNASPFTTDANNIDQQRLNAVCNEIGREI